MPSVTYMGLGFFSLSRGGGLRCQGIPNLGIFLLTFFLRFVFLQYGRPINGQTQQGNQDYVYPNVCIRQPFRRRGRSFASSQRRGIGLNALHSRQG
jgi:hypothetical protein